MTDWTARVLDAVDATRDATVGRLAELIRIPSVGGSTAEHEIVADLAAQFDAAGFDIDHWRLDVDALSKQPDFPGAEVARDEAWALVARLPGRAPDDGSSLMLNGHVDVVPPGDLGAWSGPDPYSGRVDGGVVLGRGACDMKGGLVAALAAAGALREVGVPLAGDLLLAAVPGEEDGGLGTYGLLARGWRADAAVVPEPTGLDIVPANAGALTFRLTVHGRATHASRRTEGVSALEKLLPVLAALDALERRRNADVDPLMARWPIAYPLSLGTVHAGDWASTVPDLLVAEGRYGVGLDESVESARAELEAAVAEVCAADPWLREHPVEVTWWGGQFAPGRLPADSDLAARMARAHRAAGGSAEPQTWGGPYGSDLRLLNGAGVPTLHYGPGDAALAHAADERVPLDEVMHCARALALLAIDRCGIHN